MKQQAIIEKALHQLNIKTLNPMQQAAIEAMAQHQQMILLSATGSGKTLAFLLPLVFDLQKNKKGTQALVIVPSRELAQQIEKVFKQMATGFKVTCCYGGHLRETEENNLAEAPALIVGTPGRLADHIRRQNITVDTIEWLVLDEFDKSLELGFEEEMSFVVQSLPALKKKMLTSATDATELPGFLDLSDPKKLNFLDPQAQTSHALAVQQVVSTDHDKLETLFRLICKLGNRSTLVFCNHRDAVERTSKYLKGQGIINEYYHGALEQRDRDAALVKFRNGTVNVLVTTDLAARGLDIPNIRYIIHYHLPHTEDAFVHRNGRTARMEASGTAILITGPGEALPGYVASDPEMITLPEEAILPEAPRWSTLYISSGKKDKINKIDIVGFFTNKGQLKKDDIGLVEVKDFAAFVAIRKNHVGHVLQLIKNEKIKGKKVKIEVAK